MGVSGSGKSTIAQILAKRNQYEMLDADDLHSPESIEKMREGYPLNDNDRAPWLARIANRYAEAKQQNRSLVIACSALKARYREVLRGGDDTLFTVYLDVNPKVLIKRMETRKHFMPPALLKSQLNTLELPTNENNTLVVDATIKPSQIIVNINQWLEQYS